MVNFMNVTLCNKEQPKMDKMDTGREQAGKLMTEDLRTITICDAFDQLCFEDEPTKHQPTFAVEQNDSGLGDEIHQLPSANKDEICTSRNILGNFQVPNSYMDTPHMIFVRDEDGDTLLHLSIIHGKESIISDIIHKTPNSTYLNIANDLYQTALHIAVITRQERIVKRLVCAGASVDVQDRLGNTPLHIACAHGYYDIVQALLKPVEYYKETMSNNNEIPDQRQHLNMNSRNFDGFTCLHLAVLNNHIDVCCLILEAGADINVGHGKDGRTALHLVSETGNTEMLSFLVQNGNATLEANDFAGLTPFQLALGRGCKDIQKLLLFSGASYKSLIFDEESDETLGPYREE